MRKLLSILFALTLLLSSLTLPCLADEKSSDDSILIFSFDKGMGSFRKDTENQLEGEGCGSLNFKGDQISGTNFDAVDITGYESFEFDLYLSDAAYFDYLEGAQVQLEITSSKGPDVEEIFYTADAIKNGIEGGPQVGWNHVVLHIANATPAGEFNPANVNFIRYYTIGIVNRPSEPITVKLDNFRATMNLTMALEKAAQELAVFGDEVMALGELPTLTADNIESITASVKALRAQFDTYDSLQQSVMPTEAYQLLLDYENAIRSYHLTPETAPAPESAETADSAEDSTEAPQDSESASSLLPVVIGCAVVVLIAVAVVIVMKGRKKA